MRLSEASLVSILTSLVAQIVKILSAMQVTCILSLHWEDPLKKGMATSPEFLPGRFRGQRSPACYSPWGHKEQDTTELLSISI